MRDKITETPPLVSHEEAQHRAAYGNENGPSEARAYTYMSMPIHDIDTAVSAMLEHKKNAAQVGINPKDLVGATKAPLGLLPWTALIQVAPVFALGAAKYGPYNWRERGKPVQHMTYVEAAFRHLAAYVDGETTDPESGVSHLAHAVAGLLILLDASAVGNSKDNRPTPGVAAELLAIQAKK